MAARIAAGDVAAQELARPAHLHLVKRIAALYLHRGLSHDDLVGEGNLGLIRAAQDYDPEQGTAFNTYATYWIKDAIISALRRTAQTIRLPAQVTKLVSRWKRVKHDLARAGGHTPSFDEVASAMGLDPFERDLMARAQLASSLRLGCLSTQHFTSRGGCLPTGRYRPDELIEDAEEQAVVFGRLECLGGLERHAVTLRFGLEGEPPRSFTDISDRLGVTRDAVRKLTTGAIRKLANATAV